VTYLVAAHGLSENKHVHKDWGRMSGTCWPGSGRGRELALEDLDGVGTAQIPS
jgi:hypothetical protein